MCSFDIKIRYPLPPPLPPNGPVRTVIKSRPRLNESAAKRERERERDYSGEWRVKTRDTGLVPKALSSIRIRNNPQSNLREGQQQLDTSCFEGSDIRSRRGVLSTCSEGGIERNDLGSGRLEVW